METVRVDVWIWSVRLTKTRSDATALCKAGHVKVDGRSAKPATTVKVGDRVTARIHQVDRDVEVVRIIDKRVGAAVAAECLVDHSPPPPPKEAMPPVLFGQRDRGTGRPTKRDRRLTERLRGRDLRG